MTITSRVKSFLNDSVSGPFIVTKEAVTPTTPGADQDEALWNPFTITGPRKTRDLPRIEHGRMLDIAHWFYKGNPIGKRIIEIMGEYVIGNGIQFAAEDESVMKVLKNHWLNPTNKWSTLQLDRCRDLGLTGELIIPVSVNQTNGGVFLGNIDPELVQSIVQDPINSMKVHAIILKKGHGETFHRAYRVIDFAPVDSGEEIRGKLFGIAQNQEEQDSWNLEFKMNDVVKIPNLRLEHTAEARWSGACFYFKINSPLGAIRGWSDLLPLLDWMDLHDQFLFSQVQKGINSGLFGMDVTLEGHDPKQIEEYAKKQTKRRPGEESYHNEKVTNKFMAPDLQMDDSSILSSVLKSHIMSGAGFPVFWFGETLGSRASAPEQTDPAFKHIVARQRIYAYVIGYIFQYVIDMAVLYGTLKMDNRKATDSQRKDMSFFLKMPDVSAKDQRMISIAVRNYSAALKEATEAQFITQDEASSMFKNFIKLSGSSTNEDQPRFDDAGQDRLVDPTEISSIFKRVRESKTNIDMLHTTDENTLYMFMDYAA